MYSNTKCSTRFGSKRTTFLTEEVYDKGVCDLFPLLYNLYSNDLTILPNGSPGCLFYADDSVLSSSRIKHTTEMKYSRAIFEAV